MMSNAYIEWKCDTQQSKRLLFDLNLEQDQSINY